jgi:outer membrane protein TolC
LPTLPTNLLGNVAFGGAGDRFDLAELHAQWTLCDFGRRAGRYGQAQLAVHVAQLQYNRARQTVIFQVTAAYLGLLLARANVRVAEESIKRAESVLRDARNFQRRGVSVRNDVLRAEVLLAEMRLGLVKTRTAQRVAVALLNERIGINVSTATCVADRTDAPPVRLSLVDCLEAAVANRQEFGVVLDQVRSARFATGVAQADFMPRVLVGGVAAQERSNNVSSADLVAGGLAIDLVLFEGGKRLGRLRTAEAEARAAVAQGKEVCDQIAYEVNVAYFALDDARQRIGLARTAVAQATENLRVVRSLIDRGDATPTDVVDAELALTRAQQNDYAALYDYETAVARLAYAIGVAVPDGILSLCGGSPHE